MKIMREIFLIRTHIYFLVLFFQEDDCSFELKLYSLVVS